MRFVIFGKKNGIIKPFELQKQYKKKEFKKNKVEKKATKFLIVFTIFSSKNSKEKILQFFIFLWLKTAA